MDDITTTEATLSPAAIEAAIHKLAQLSLLEFELQREAKAKLFGMRVGVLENEVKNRRPTSEPTVNDLDDHCDALALAPAEVAPPGNEIHAAMVNLIRRYIYLPDTRTAEIIALWCMYTHAIEAFRIAPKMLITAPDRACGKSTLLEVVASLSCRCESLVGVSPAVIYRIVEAHRPTLAFDEVDNMRNSPGYDEISAIMNAGHKRGSYVWRCDGDTHEPKKFFVFGAQLIAMIGRPKDTTASRSIVVELARATATESCHLSDISDIDPLADWEPLREKAFRWGIDNESILRAPPELPDGVHGRHRDNWRPLLRVAEVIGNDKLIDLTRGMCREAAGGEVSAHGFTDRMMRAISIELANYKEQYPQESNIHSAHLYECLNSNHDLIPDDWTVKRLTRFISKYQCSSFQCRAMGDNRKGYPVSRLYDVVSRYTGEVIETPKQASTDKGLSPSRIETGGAV